MTRFFLLTAFLLTTSTASAQWFFPRWSYPTTGNRCVDGQCRQEAKPSPSQTKEGKKQGDSFYGKRPTEAGTELSARKREPGSSGRPLVETLPVARTRFYAPSVEIADACDEILDRLEERYGKPKVWNAFPVYFERYRGDGIAGYTSYVAPNVAKVVCFEPFETAKGGTLDHELTHAFFFYFLNSNFDLFLNEGLAQNSEYRRRETLRQTVYRRYNNGEFWDISRLYGRNRYDNSLLIYHEGFSVVDFLIARGGSKWFAEFMTELVKTNDVDNALARFYGYKNLKELQTAWIEYIEGGQNRGSVKAVY